MHEEISLAKLIKIKNNTRILYSFNNDEYYIKNLIAYIKACIENGDHIFVIENSLIFDITMEIIKKNLSKEQQELIHFVDNYNYYRYDKSFSISTVLNPYSKENIIIRTWAHVVWKQQNNIDGKVAKMEKLANSSIQEMNVMSVCTYASTDISASLQNILMRSHEYLMTDTEFVRSPFYKEDNNVS